MISLTSTVIICLYFLVEIKSISSKDLISLGCPELKDIDSVTIKPLYSREVRISCDEGLVLSSQTQVECVEGEWRLRTHQICKPQECSQPPQIENGFVKMDNDKDDRLYYPKGALAVYSCVDGFKLSPLENKYKVCEKGMWIGGDAKCVPIIKACPQPKDIHNGYYVQENSGNGYDQEAFGIGQRLHYSCRRGYVLEGTSVQQCLEDGTWSPKISPSCILPLPDSENTDFYSCHPLPKVQHSKKSIEESFDSDKGVPHGTVIEITCTGDFKNSRAPCQSAKMTCNSGRWTGLLPICVPAYECDPPPKVLFASSISTEMLSNKKYPINSNVSYQCAPGYTLDGNNVLTCMRNGCWGPNEVPFCLKDYYVEVDNFNSIMISIATGIGVLGILLLICVIMIYRRRKSISRNITIPAPIQRAQLSLGDHAALLHHPDRLALIAFADGLQEGCQSSLPSYDEATREQRGSGLTANRLHRPHWPNLAVGRRARNSPNPDLAHQVTRHGSFVSHTPSTRSAGDSMGSTDTMAVSEGSTAVTLDTVSSHSSQPASCRVHCGSLASFDACSVVNPDDVPLLEESELEDIQNDNTPHNIVDCNSSNSDSISFKNHSSDLS